MTRECMEFDVAIIGAGPSGLSTACRLMQKAKENKQSLNICVLEKGSEVGAHILSGAVFDTRALDELFPNWKAENAPVTTKVTQDHVFYFFNKKRAFKIPHLFLPKSMKNKDHYVISLGNLCRWLAEKAETLGVEIFPSFSAHELIIENNQVKGVITGDMGVASNGDKKSTFLPGVEIRAKYTVFAEGCRGHLGQQLIKKFDLDENQDPQHYALGFKELWEVSDQSKKIGQVMHSTGWPLSNTQTTGGGFMYHLSEREVVVGLVVDLNYTHPYLDPFEEFQQFKRHTIVQSVLKNGKRLSYGARAITKGGIQSLPKMIFPGGLLIGCDAGTLDSAKIKGSHTAMKSGMIAAECIFEALNQKKPDLTLSEYTQLFHKSWVYQSLYAHRNFTPLIHQFGILLGGAINYMNLLCNSKLIPWTLHEKIPDFKKLKMAQYVQPIIYPKPDSKITFDRLSSVFLSNTNHEEDQKCHLKLQQANIPIEANLPLYAEPAQRYCPAGVYEVVEQNDFTKKFVINAQNCIHCKTCDIKDPSQNIIWETPEGGGGPNYPNM
ncbi:MAG: electron transfer flavoprotein-ubiquinone oxidoreductase [Endozoicomonadaceae bacterium]|nr:electron transfer flavoprotein-ubiquinone oxidoreductase [Endozoicomonadaceae bacterium]